MTEERLRAFAVAWASGDVDLILSFFTEDGVYRASVGPEPGRRYVGRPALRAGIEAMLAHDAGSHSEVGHLHVQATYGSWEWTYTFADGRVELGCDLFEFQGDRIRVKNAYRKVLQ